MTPLLSLACLASALWLIASWRRPDARPIAIALAVVTLTDLARELDLAARLDLALLLSHPVVSAWCVWRVMWKR